MNPQPLHLGEPFAGRASSAPGLVNSLFTLSLLVGISVHETTLGTTWPTSASRTWRSPPGVPRRHDPGADRGGGRRGSSSRPTRASSRSSTGPTTSDELVARCRRAALMHRRPKVRRDALAQHAVRPRAPARAGRQGPGRRPTWSSSTWRTRSRPRPRRGPAGGGGGGRPPCRAGGGLRAGQPAGHAVVAGDVDALPDGLEQRSSCPSGTRRVDVGHPVVAGLETVRGVADVRRCSARRWWPATSGPRTSSPTWAASHPGEPRGALRPVGRGHRRPAGRRPGARRGHLDYGDGDRFTEEAAERRALGYAGKLCIHPARCRWPTRPSAVGGRGGPGRRLLAAFDAAGGGDLVRGPDGRRGRGRPGPGGPGPRRARRRLTPLAGAPHLPPVRGGRDSSRPVVGQGGFR